LRSTKRLKKIIKIYFIAQLFFLSCGLTFAQNNPLANQIRLAKSFESKGDFEEAEKIYAKIYDEQPKNYQFYNFYYNVLMNQKKYDDALVILNGILKKIPDDSDINHLAGAAYDGIKDIDKALYHFNKVKDTSKFFENATIYIAYIYKNQNKPDQAIKILEQATQKVPDNPEFYFYLGYFHEDLQQYPQAESILKKGLEKTADNARLHFRLGVVYDKWGKKDL